MAFALGRTLKLCVVFSMLRHQNRNVRTFNANMVLLWLIKVTLIYLNTQFSNDSFSTFWLKIMHNSLMALYSLYHDQAEVSLALTEQVVSPLTSLQNCFLSLTAFMHCNVSDAVVNVYPKFPRFTLYPPFTHALRSRSYSDYGIHTGKLFWVRSGLKSRSPNLVLSRISIWIYDPLTSYPYRLCNKMAEKVKNGQIERQSYEAKKTFSVSFRV